MPVIYAHYRKEALTDQQIKDLIPKFNQIIIKRMSCKEMQLVESQILLEFIPRSPHYFEGIRSSGRDHRLGLSGPHEAGAMNGCLRWRAISRRSCRPPSSAAAASSFITLTAGSTATQPS